MITLVKMKSFIHLNSLRPKSDNNSKAVSLIFLIYLGGIFNFFYGQNHKTTDLTYQCRTFGEALGLLGGQISIIMSVISMLTGWYSTFQYESSLIEYLYTETANGQNDNNPINLKQRVEQFMPFRFSVREFMCGNLL